MGAIRVWLVGRKTYVLAAVLLLVGLGLLGTGHLTPVTAMGLLLFAACGFPVTFRAAIQRHQDEEMALLVQIAATGASITVHNYSGASVEARQVAAGAIQLGREIQAEVAVSKEATA